jgi:hypothetical protein
MFVRVEPSGCTERKGMVQVRLDFFLEEGDARYKERRIEVPSETKGETVTISAPFHCHFIYVAPDTSEKAILDIAERFLKQAYEFWENKQFPALVNIPYTKPSLTVARKVACLEKVSALTAATLERKVL